MEFHCRLRTPSTWRLDLLIVVTLLVGGFNLFYFVPCRCWFGAWDAMQLKAALLILLIGTLRYLAAWALRERNDGWKYYLVLLLFSPFLVAGAFELAVATQPAEFGIHAH